MIEKPAHPSGQEGFNQRYPEFAGDRPNVLTTENLASVLPTLVGTYTRDWLRDAQKELYDRVKEYAKLSHSSALIEEVNASFAKLPPNAPHGEGADEVAVQLVVAVQELQRRCESGEMS